MDLSLWNLLRLLPVFTIFFCSHAVIGGVTTESRLLAEIVGDTGAGKGDRAISFSKVNISIGNFLDARRGKLAAVLSELPQWRPVDASVLRYVVVPGGLARTDQG
ncbi:hypothetical protein F4821DRAFT_232620 [Hypoxylon rubiginosum]|uniref:Uncharacterized protein n=1 Tax=Hypoxylon rubiginosum TaxID=110542 RepID=A0ACC0D8V1_9PEZI|nr:hypothetical protein F4821DRAFT_232620 [Hypoxylon rubiginosum]